MLTIGSRTGPLKPRSSAADPSGVRRLLVISTMLGLLVMNGATAGTASGRIALDSPDRPAVPAVPGGFDRETVKPVRHTLVDGAGAAVHRWPGGPVVGHLAQTTPLGSHSWVWALSESKNGRWARIVLPWRPNGRTGWIAVAHRNVDRTAVWVKADLSRRTVTLFRGERVLKRFRAAIGASGSPTPVGKFSVTDLVATGDPYGSFGWYAFGLSGHQPNLPDGWGGGDQLAIHGTNDPSSIGRAASAGCLRVSAHALGVLKRHLRLGTPVIIER
jgi:lipoprotein-anchoring transpeptidase ErfK/SrfK